MYIYISVGLHWKMRILYYIYTHIVFVFVVYLTIFLASKSYGRIGVYLRT